MTPHERWCWEWSLRLQEAIDSSEFGDLFDEYLDCSSLLPVWAEGEYCAPRIGWRDGHASIKSCFKSKGAYIFGTNKQLIYVGITKENKQTLWKRLNGRFIGNSPRRQCNLALYYAFQLHSKNLCELPDWYHKIARVRKQNALAFACSGIDNVWIMLLPVNDPSILDEFEWELVKASNVAMERQGLAGLISAKKTRR